jgi:ferredoxin
MARIIVNDVVMEAQEGETLLDVARRNAAHIGFACNGNGICQTCECQVLEGHENLTRPDEAEETWLAPSRLRRGHRLACQAVINGEGEVRILTRAEELRRQVRDVLNPPAGRDSGRSLQILVNNLVQMNLEHLSLFPGNVVRTIERVGLLKVIFPFEPNQFGSWFSEGQRVIETQSDPVRADIAQTQPAMSPIPPATVTAGD